MCIEHRWTPRREAGLPVTIACRSHGVLGGKLRNISNGGALVRLPIRVPTNAAVELILPLATRAHRLPAIVTRCDDTGAGLMFGRMEPETWSALLSSLNAGEVDGAAASAFGKVASSN
jgi:hypothetical protein